MLLLYDMNILEIFPWSYKVSITLLIGTVFSHLEKLSCNVPFCKKAAYQSITYHLLKFGGSNG